MPDTIGNDFLSARRIFPIVSPQTFTEFIGVEAGVLDANDYYTFTLNRSSSVTLSLTGLSADANLEIRNSSGIVTDTDGIVLSSTNTGTLAESINAVLAAGTYYIRVFPGPATNPLDPLTTPSTNYNLRVAADSNVTPGIVWRNNASGVNSIWTMNGVTRVTFAVPLAIPDPNWRIQTTGEFNGDNNTDIVWRNYATGENLVWIMNGAARESFVFLPTNPDLNWQIVGAGDFNRDGRTDIIWRNQATNQSTIWFFNGTEYLSFAFLEASPGPEFQIQGVADFNNDGQQDILWRSYGSGVNQGANLVWLMNGATRVNSVDLPSNGDLSWQIRGAGDYNNDGRPDILWRNQVSGLTTVWFFNGTTYQSFAIVSPLEPDVNWQAFAPFDRFAAPVRADLAGNTLPTAFSIGPLNGAGSYNDFAGTTDTNDYYQFSLGSPTSLTISLTGLNGGNLQGDLDIQILNSLGGVPTVGGVPLQSVTAGNSIEQIQTPAGASLGAGTYFIRVLAKPNESSFYRLSIDSNNLPVLATQNNLTLSEGATGTISTTLLTVTDGNNTPNQLAFTLTDPPDNGSLSLNGAAIGTGNTFTQADINAGRLTYSQNGSETLTDTFAFSVSDGTPVGTLNNLTFTINVIPVNDLPTLVSNNILTATEGAAVTIDGTRLLVTDTEQTAAEIIYSLNSTPANGILLLNGTTLAAGGTFTQADVTAGNRLSYVHNGSETTSDSFAFTALDGAGGTVLPAPTTFSIAVTGVNDPPALVTNAGLTLNQDQSVRLTSATLRVTDAEFSTSADQDLLVYTVTVPPTRGTLFLNGTQTNTFTQADINNGRIEYDHDGSPTNSDRFTFTATDGANPIGPFTFNITVISVNFPPGLTTNNPLTLSEGLSAQIGQTLLQTTDLDTAPPSLLYTLTSLPANGQLRRDNATLSVGQTFSQSDINNNRVSYLHNGSETIDDRFTFTLSDGSGNVIPTQTFTISVLPVNDPPILATNIGLTLSEGTVQNIGATLLQATDVDSLISQLTYTVASAPASGTLLLAGNTAPLTFTQSDINNGLLRYQHNGSESTADSFTFNLSDGTASLGLRTFNIAVLPVNDPPVVATNLGLTLNEGTSSAINSPTLTRLAVTDDDGANTVTLTLLSAPTRGTLLRGTTTLTSGQFFTPGDLNNLLYTHDGSETTSDFFTFSGTDGSTGVLAPTTFSINVSPVDDLPVLISNRGLSLAEGSTVTFTNDLLQTTDAETPLASNIVYNVTNAPPNGTLLLAGVQVTSFTQADVNSGQLRYQHNGSETVADNFTVNITAGATSLNSQVINIVVAPVNDNPGLAANTILTVTENDPPTVISNNALRLTDNDGPGPIVYTLTSVPTSGTLFLGTSPLSVGQIFTQANVDNNLLIYANNGSETTSDRFTFTASDSSTGVLPLTTFSINVTPSDDLPVLVSNTLLSLSEGGVSTLGSTLLQATDAETPLAVNVVYNVTNGPVNGTLLLAGAPVTSFTQADINSGQLQYSHSGSETVADNFVFSVTGGTGPAITGQTFNIAVAAVNDNPGLSANTGLTVTEGDPPTLIVSGALAITDNDGPGPLLYTLASTPTSGTLLLGNAPLTIGQTFSQAQINNNQLAYANNGSETTSDRFTFTASDSSTGVLPLTTFNIAINAFDDFPVLISNTGLSLSEGGLATINATLLAATDAETPLPANITYNVTNAPGQGTLLRAGTPVSSFTQADINSGQLRYRHNGSETVTDTFTFNVVDGTGRTLGNQIFNIAITPVNDQPGISLNTALQVNENGSAVITSTNNLLITDNDGPGPITYTISEGPTRGTLLLGTVTLSVGQTFTQDDIDTALLSYRHNGSETTSDRFTFTASDGSTGTVPLTTFNIAVAPANDPPVITVPGTISVNEDTSLAFTGANVVQVTDVDNTNLQVTLSTGATAGTLSLNPGSLTATGNGTNSVVISGALSALNSALSSLTFRGTQDFNGPATITVEANDLNGGTDIRTIDVTVIPVNDAPTLNVQPVAAVDEDTSLAITGITLTDVDSNLGPIQATLTVTNGGLTINDTSGITFDSTENGASTIIFTGTVASVQSALSSLSYLGNRDFFGSDTIRIVINDQGNTGIGGPQNASRTIPITVNSVNDRPTFTAGPDVTILEDSGARTITGWATNISPGPANESGQIVNFAVTSNSNPTLFATAPTIASNGTLTFTPALNANGFADVVIELRDNGGGTNASLPVTLRIGVTPVNDVPSFTRGANQIVTEDAGLQTVTNWATAITPGGGPDEATQALTFEVTNSNSTLFTLEPTIAPNGTLTYQAAPDANGVAVVTVRLRDSGGTDNGGIDASALQSFTITVNAVNDAPNLTVPGAQATNEDETLTITGVSFTDVDAGSGTLQVRLTAQSGQIGFTNPPGVTVAGNNTGSVTLSGNQAALNAALTSFTYRGNANFQGPTDTLTITVSDQGNTGAGGTLTDTDTIAIAVNAVNDPPTVTVPSTTQNVQEDTDLVLTGINVTDPDAGSGTVQFTITALNGTLNFTNTAGATVTNNNSGQVVLAGTLAQIRTALTTASNLRYRGNQDYNGPDTITVTLDDQSNTGSGGPLSDSKSFSVNVTPVNDLPTLTLPTGPLTLNEDDPTGLLFTQGTLTEILLTDVDSANSPIRVALSVNRGTLSLPTTNGLTPVSGANGTSNFVFTGTIENVIAALNNLNYRSNPNFNGSDVLTITVNDQGNTGSGITPTPDVVRSLTINVTAVNDAPVLISNRGLTLNEGDTRQILSSLLNTTDADAADTPPTDTPDQIIYTLVNRPNPVNGSLQLVNGATTLTLADTGTFTQADINAGRLRYVHSGSENPTDSFTFRVSDGDVSIPGPTTTYTFNVRVNPVNDIPVVISNQPLTLSEGNTSIISNTLLRASDADNTAAQLRYTLTSTPTNGFLLLNGSTLSANQTFSQVDINSGALSYQHNGGESTNDSFNFVVADTAGASTNSTRFTVQVISVNDVPTIVSRGPLTLNEGAAVTINNTVLRTIDPDGPQPLTYSLTDIPTTGTLRLGSTVLTIGSRFTQQDIDFGQLSYEHNGNEVFEDVLTFAVTDDNFATSTRSFLRVVVNPVNDPPRLITNAGLIVDGTTPNSVIPIGRGILQVTDPDTVDQNLVYTLTAVPNRSVGVLQLNGSELAVGQAFTQADINSGRVTFRYFSEGFSENFQFTVSDGSGGFVGTSFFNIFFDYTGS